MPRLRSRVSLKPRSVALVYGWSESERTPLSLRIVRRRAAYPSGESDGHAVLHGGMLLGPGGALEAAAWGRELLLRCHVTGSSQGDGMTQALLAIAFGTDGTPQRALLEYFDDAPEPTMQTLSLDDLSQMTLEDGTTPDTQRLQLWTAGGTGDELALTMEIRWDASGSQVQWFVGADTTPLSQHSCDAVLVEHVLPVAEESLPVPAIPDPAGEQIRHEVWETRVVAIERLSAEVVSAPLDSAMLRRRYVLHDEFRVDMDRWDRELSIEDHALEPESFYYYRLFADPVQAPGRDEECVAASLATGQHGLLEYTHRSLPAHLRQADEPTPDLQPSLEHPERGGQLRRFVGLFGMALDHIQGSARALQSRHDVEETPAKFLPQMARAIGWEPDFTVGEQQQRRDIRFAPELFSTVGTLPNTRALVHRATGLTCRTKEYVHNVMLTNAVERISLWDIWTATLTAGTWGEATQFSPASESRGQALDPFAGRPTSALGAGGVRQTYWHSDHGGQWDIFRVEGGGPATPVRALPASSEPRTNPYALQVEGEVWLAWDQGGEGARDLWLARGEHAPERVTEHPAEDSRPCMVVDSDLRVWVFWQSARRGGFDVWFRVFATGAWEAGPRRLTRTLAPDTAPAAAVDDTGNVYLFWLQSHGSRRVLMHSVRPADVAGHPGQNWSAEAPLALPDAPVDADAPTAILSGSTMHLFWHSNRDGSASRIWTSQLSGGSWSAPVALTDGRQDDREPGAALVGGGGGDVQLFWRSQKRGLQYRSRTFEASMRADRDTLADRAHYTLDTRDAPNARYGRGVVGLFIDPGSASAADVEHRRQVAAALTATYRPANTRFVWDVEALPPDDVT